MFLDATSTEARERMGKSNGIDPSTRRYAITEYDVIRRGEAMGFFIELADLEFAGRTIILRAIEWKGVQPRHQVSGVGKVADSWLEFTESTQNHVKLEKDAPLYF